MQVISIIKSIFLTVALTGFAAAAAAAGQMTNNQNLDAADSNISAVNNCAWYGAAPICNAKCPAGTNESRRDSYGDGKCCRTGSKVLCCS